MPLISDSLRNLSSALVIAALIIAGLVLGRDILIPMALAVLLAFVLSPIVRALMRLKFAKPLAVGIVMLGTVASIAVFATVVSRQVISLTADLSSYSYNVLEKVRAVTGRPGEKNEISKAADAVDKLGDAIRSELAGDDAVAKPEGSAAASTSKTIVVEKDTSSSGVFDYLGVAIEPLAQVALSILLTTFLLIQYQDLRDRLVRVVGTDHMTDTISAMGEAGERLSQLFLMQAALNIGFGIVVGTALWFVGVPNAVLWGVVAAIMRFVPFIGSFISALPPMLLAAAVDPGWGKFLATAGIFVIGEPLMGHVVEPLALGKRAGISPFAMVTSASFWTLVWGPIGLILAAPLTMTLIVIGKYIPGLEFLSVLLGDEPALSPPHELYHRLLSDDAASAANQIDRALEAPESGDVADRLIFPALALAAQDYRRGRLDREQVEDFSETSAEVWQTIAEDLADAESTPQDTPEKRRLLVVPARGAIDGVAAAFVAAAVDARAGGLAVTKSGSSGLTAIADAKARPEAEQPEELIIVSVSGIEAAQLNYIVRRAARDFPLVNIAVIDFRPDPVGVTPRKNSVSENVTAFKAPSSVVEHFVLLARSLPARNSESWAPKAVVGGISAG